MRYSIKLVQQQISNRNIYGASPEMTVLGINLCLFKVTLVPAMVYDKRLQVARRAPIVGAADSDNVMVVSA